MNTHPTSKQRHTAALSCFFLLALMLMAARATAAEPSASTISPTASISDSSIHAPAVLGSWWSEWTTSVWSGLSSRRAMMRFGAIIFVVALAAIWWRKT